jgi:uncharacterized protein
MRHTSLAPLLITLTLGAGPALAAPTGPSFDCRQVAAGSIPALICQDAGLSALDRQLAQVYAQASQKAKTERPPRLKAEQRGWVKGRDDCWKAQDQASCVRGETQRRIAELQARYRLVPSIATARYRCDDAPGSEVLATYFRTEPPSLIAERGDQQSLMFSVPSASGAKYEGRNEMLWEHQGEAQVVWGYGATPLRCKKQD